MTYKPSKLGHTDLFFILIRAPVYMPDYKSVYVAVMIHATLVNT